MLELGIKAPDFELPDQNGEMHKLSDSVGKHMGDPDEVALACMLIKQHYGMEV